LTSLRLDGFGLKAFGESRQKPNEFAKMADQDWLRPVKAGQGWRGQKMRMKSQARPETGLRLCG